MGFVYLNADINVKYTNNSDFETLKTLKINGKNYFSINQLDKILLAKINEDIIDQRISIQIYNETLIFLLESSYVQFQNKIYNFKYPIIFKDANYFLPSIFATNILTKFFPDKINYKNKSLTVSLLYDNRIKLIVLDPGHGGKDPGAISYSKKIFEKTIALIIAKKVKKLIDESDLDVKVVLTRTEDKFVSLKERTTLANDIKADIFVSIHCNANRSSKAHGAEVYYLSTAKTSEARAVAAFENSVVEKYEGGAEALKKYDDVSLILADMSQTEHLQESYELADELEENIVSKTAFYKRGVKQANFYVMRGAFMPAVLVEAGFLSNPEEEIKLKDPIYQDKIAKAIFESLKFFKSKFDKM